MKRTGVPVVAIQGLVAPRRGAWIETKADQAQIDFLKSHPAGVRGLKQYRLLIQFPPLCWSHPAGVRGLKLCRPV